MNIFVRIKRIIKYKIYSSLKTFAFILRPFKILLVNYYYLIKNNRSDSKKYYLAICACFKNEGQFFKEWIEYHKIIGVEHFYLYNNESTDDYQGILSDYINDGLVTIIDYPGKGIQYKVYEDCFKKCHQDVNWLAFVDLDEFICPKYDSTGPLIFNFEKQSHSSSSDINLRKLLEKFRKYPVIKIWWKQFGSNGVIRRDQNKTVIEQFVACEPDNAKYNWTKCILNMDYWENIDPLGLHDFDTSLKFAFLTFKISAFNEFAYSDAKAKLNRSIQINHYTNKSYNDFVSRKMINGRADHLVLEEDKTLSLDAYFWIEYRCTERDFTILRFLTQLKMKLGDHKK